MTTTSTLFRSDAEVSAGYWIIDPTHSRIGFRVRNWIVTTVTGAFAEYDGALDERDQLGGIPALAEDVEPRALQQTGQPLAKQNIIIRQHHPRAHTR
jgi:hypothetical protein